MINEPDVSLDPEVPAEIPDDIYTVGQYLDNNPDENTVDQIAGATSLDPVRVREILDEWRPAGDGSFEHVGPGGGGMWVTLDDDAEIPNSVEPE